MCLIKDREQIVCFHPTCLRAKQNPDFFKHTKRSVFIRRSDFSKVRLRRNAEVKPIVVTPVNPHLKNTDTWASFSKFQETCTLKVASNWPSKAVFNKGEIEIQFFLYARKVQGTYNGLRDEYDYSIVLDVEEGAVFIGS